MRHLLKLCTQIFCIVAISGCSTIYTLTADGESFHKEACANDCSTVPRIYSGTAMDLCAVFTPDGGQGSAIMFYDLFLSFPLDTIVLPYTIYGQITEGSLSEKSQCKARGIPPNKQINKD
jgi:uncharacterized protein YceK